MVVVDDVIKSLHYFPVLGHSQFSRYYNLFYSVFKDHKCLQYVIFRLSV